MRRTDRAVTDNRQIQSIIEQAKVVHIGMIDNDRPYVVPMQYGFVFADGQLTLYVHCAKEGRKLDIIKKNPRVFIELETNVEIISGGDIPCKYGSEYASVMGDGTAVFVEDVKEKFSSEYLKNQIDLMMKMCDKSPTDAIGKSKELIESCCKSILNRLGEFEGNTLKTSQLVKRTMNALNIPDKEEEDTTGKIIGSLNGLSSGVNELRNQYGTGHGKSEKFKSLSRRHANLSVGASAVLVQYLWDTYLYKARMKK